jgi:NTE family protein
VPPDGRNRQSCREHVFRVNVNPRVGLVLGAGGTVGQAYHAGVLAALEHDLGWDPRTAEVIVGTSAGAITGALLRLGIPAHDLAAWAVQAPLSVEGTRLRTWFGKTHPEFPPLDARHLLRPWRLPPPAHAAARGAADDAARGDERAAPPHRPDR